MSVRGTRQFVRIRYLKKRKFLLTNSFFPHSELEHLWNQNFPHRMFYSCQNKILIDIHPVWYTISSFYNISYFPWVKSYVPVPVRVCILRICSNAPYFKKRWGGGDDLDIYRTVFLNQN
jgi:hypothetical protein